MISRQDTFLKNNTGAIILAAGNSVRMGQCKFLMPLPNGLSFIENIVNEFTLFGIEKIIIVTQHNNFNTLKKLFKHKTNKPIFVLNNFPEFDRFYSLQIGINALENVDYCFIHNADNPFIDISTLKLLFSDREKADYVCPVYNNNGGHPILTNISILNQLLKSPADSILNEELKKRSRLNVSVDNQLILVDIDTPSDYKKYIN